MRYQKPKFGISLFSYSVDGTSYEKQLKLAQKSEELGYDYILSTVQFTPLYYNRVKRGLLKVQDGYDETHLKEVLDPLTLATFIASKTKRIRIGLAGAPLPFLPPYYWAQYYTTLDVLSKGRAIAGVCVGTAEEDFELFGVDLKKRGRMTDESLDIMLRLWKEDVVTYRGKYYSLENATLYPKPIQKPHPPILDAGNEKTIPRALKYGAEFISPFSQSPRDIAQKYNPQLEGSKCKVMPYTILAVGSNSKELNDVLPTARNLIHFFGSAFVGGKLEPEDVGAVGLPEEAAKKIKEYQKVGVNDFLLDCQHHGTLSVDRTLRQIEVFAKEVIPLL